MLLIDPLPLRLLLLVGVLVHVCVTVADPVATVELVAETLGDRELDPDPVDVRVLVTDCVHVASAELLGLPLALPLWLTLPLLVREVVGLPVLVLDPVTVRVTDPEALTVSVPIPLRVGVGAAEAERVSETDLVTVPEAEGLCEDETDRVPVVDTVPLRDTEGLPVVVRVLVVEKVLDHVRT